MMRLKLASTPGAALLLVVSAVSLSVVCAADGQVSSRETIVRSKRQASRDRQRSSQDAPIRDSPNRPGVSMSAGGSLAMATAGQVPNLREPKGKLDVATDSEAPVGGLASNLAVSIDDDDDNNNRRPVRPKKRPSRRPATPSRQDGDDYARYDDDDDCDEANDEDDDGNYHHHPFGNPMRQFRRLMNSAIDRMQGAYDDYGAGSRAGSSSSAGSGGGYSRAVSSVTNNGRTRGIISETRNGRTQIRRIGSRDDADEDDGANYDA